jgi:hypothetical protein
MRSHLKTLVIGALLSLPLLGLGAGFLFLGVEAAVHQRVWLARGSKFRFPPRPPTPVRDITHLNGPGLILSGVSLIAGGLLVIPSGLIWEHAKNRRFWPRIVFLWKLIGIGVAVGAGLSILAVFLSALWVGVSAVIFTNRRHHRTYGLVAKGKTRGSPDKTARFFLSSPPCIVRGLRDDDR